jgi:hypothetical protein
VRVLAKELRPFRNTEPTKETIEAYTAKLVHFIQGVIVDAVLVRRAGGEQAKPWWIEEIKKLV